jgi:hypothetical protein
MAKPFELLPSVLNELGGRIERNAGKAVQRAASSIHSRVVPDTPFRTGNAASNWIVTRNAAFSGVAGIAGEANLAAKAAVVSATIAQGQIAINSFSISRDRSIHITNNVDYLYLLNAGRSNQAPAMFVERSVQAGAGVVRGVKLLKR